MAHKVSDPLVEQLVDDLKREQEARGWTDEQMASDLGFGQATWTYLRRGERGLGLEGVCRLVMKRSVLLGRVIPFFRQLSDGSARQE